MVGQQGDELGLVLRLEQVREDACPPPSGWFSRLLLECCYSAGRATRLENAPAGSLANAAFVGAKTVYSKLYALRNNVSFRTYAYPAPGTVPGEPGSAKRRFF